jgi:hypothetical protein
VTLCLTPEEIKEVTEKTYRPAQIKVLRALGIEPKVRPDGSLVVYRALLDEAMRGEDNNGKSREREKTRPRWVS